MINAETGAFQLSGVWCNPGDSRVDLENRLKPFTWVKSLYPNNNLSEVNTSVKDAYFLQIRFEDIFGMLSFRKGGLALVKFGLVSISELSNFQRQVRAYKAFLSKTCGLTPGAYNWGSIRVNEDFRDGSSEIDVIYD